MAKMTIVEALRRCLYENGVDMLLDYPKLRGKLWDLAPNEYLERQRFAALYDTGAMESVHKAIMDVTTYEECFAEAMQRLCRAEGMTVPIAEEVLMLFYDALGFPTKSPILNPQSILEEDCEYRGEVKNGKRHGRGRETLLYDGKPYNIREGLWIENEVFGYLYSVDDLETKEYCFCIKGRIVGKDTHITKDGQVFVDEY